VYTQLRELFVQSVYVHVYVLFPWHTGSGPTTGPVGVIEAPQELFTVGGVGTTCASLIHATVDEPAAGTVNVGGDTVYVNTQFKELFVQSVYVHVYVFVPEHTGSGPTTGPVGVIEVPHEFDTVGGVGTVCASLIHATVAEPAPGNENVGGLIVYVYTQSAELPSQLVYVHVYVFVPKQTGSGPTTGPVGVITSPHEFVTVGGVGTVCASLIQATVDDPAGGKVNVDGSTV
jgi:hypothetical protein